MKDWDEALCDWDGEDDGPVGAIPAAHEAASSPLTCAMLDLCSRGMEFPFKASPKAMARLLDIAILTGNRKAAVNLSKKCQLRPLRRWAMNWTFDNCWNAARTALWAGAGFQDLMAKGPLLSNEEEGVPGFHDDVPFPQALFLRSKLEDWQEIRHLLPGCHDLLRPRNLNNRLGEFFLEHDAHDDLQVSKEKIRSAQDAGLDLAMWFVEVRCRGDDRLLGVTLLDLAMWCGQPDCVEACVDGGIELKDDDRTLAWHKQVLRGGVPLGFPLRVLSVQELRCVPSGASIAAAAAAGSAWLKRLWKSESSQKGFVLYQMMLKMFKGRSFPMAVVQEILTFSMPVPKIIDQLDLWEHVHPAADCNTSDVEEPEEMQDNGEAGTLLYIEVFVLFSFVCFQGSR